MKTFIIRRRKLGMSSARGISEASTTGIRTIRNWLENVPGDADLVIRWGCSSNVPCRNVLNTAGAIHQVADKRGFRQLISQNNADLATRTWFNINDFNPDWFDDGGKLVVRGAVHAQARNMDVATNMEELVDACDQYDNRGYYFNALIEKEAEYRVTFVQGRVAWVAQKTPGNPDDVAWNVAKGGRFDNVRWGDWPLAVLEVARAAFELSSLDFGGVDVMVEKGTGRPYVLEINSAPSLTSPYRQQCMAKTFDYIINRRQYMSHKESKVRMDRVTDKGWRGYIHPGLHDEAC